MPVIRFWVTLASRERSRPPRAPATILLVRAAQGVGWEGVRLAIEDDLLSGAFAPQLYRQHDHLTVGLAVTGRHPVARTGDPAGPLPERCAAFLAGIALRSFAVDPA
jgi:hypothetical protein